MLMKKNPVRKKSVVKFLHLLEIIFKIVLHHMFHHEFWSHLVLGCRYIIDEHVNLRSLPGDMMCFSSSHRFMHDGLMTPFCIRVKLELPYRVTLSKIKLIFWKRLGLMKGGKIKEGI